MTTDNAKTRMITADDPVVKVMQEIHHALACAAEAFGLPLALEGLANILIINLTGAYGEEAAMAILSQIAATAAPVARQWCDVTAAAHHKPGHA
jgi:hypothetical protein